MGARRLSRSAIEDAGGEDTVVALRPVPATAMTPPRGMARAARTVWKEVVSSFPADHFSPCDRPLLEAFASAAVRANELAKLLDIEGAIITSASGCRVRNPAFDAHVTACACMTSLAGRLRIAPSSRMRVDAADTRPVPKSETVKRPWSR